MPTSLLVTLTVVRAYCRLPTGVKDSPHASASMIFNSLTGLYLVVHALYFHTCANALCVSVPLYFLHF